jgi:dTDP-glucose 4,6-dehydratase
VFNRYRRRDGVRFAYHQLDLNTDMPEIVELLERERPDVIVNFAAQSEVAPSWERPWDWYQTNVVALSKLTSRLVHADWLQKYVHISSPEVYGTTEGLVTESHALDPSTPYAASKAAADIHLSTLVKNFGFPLAWIRSTNVYGAGQQLFKIIPRSLIRLRTGEPIELHGGGGAIKSYIHIRDVSRGELAVAASANALGGWHLSPDEGVTVREVVRRCCAIAGREFEQATRVVGERPGQDKAYVISSERARERLGWTPAVGLDQGLEEVAAWIDDHWEEIARLPHEYQHRP